MLWLIPSVQAQESSVTQSYASNDFNLSIGMAVSTSLNDSSDQVFIERANIGNAARFLGVVSDIQNSTVTLTDEQRDNPVVTEGEVLAYVSDINGGVSRGDFVALSPLAGILMRADQRTDSYIVGTVVGSEPLEEERVSATINDQVREVQVVQQKISLTKDYFRDNKANRSIIYVIGESLTGREVSAWRVVVAAAILLFIIVIEGAVIYSTVKNATIAMGRNPLSKTAILQELLHVAWLVVMIFVIGAGAVVALLWL